MRNGRRSANQLRTRKLPKAKWPPTDWDECELHRDRETRLPTALHPFHIDRDHETGLWSLTYEGIKDNVPIQDSFSDIFSAFRAMLDAYEQWLPSRPSPRIYFIGTELRRGAAIKVGFSYNPEERLKQLQTATPERLRILATTPGTKDDEAKYHRRWRLRRQAGEWFTVGECIIDEIERLNAQTA